MKHSYVSFLTGNVPAMRAFYEAIFGETAEGDDIHCGLSAGGMSLIFYAKSAARDDMGMSLDPAMHGGNVLIGFDVADVDAEFARLAPLGVDFVTTPTTWPWGARSFHFRDPDGNIICFHMRATAQ